MPPARCGQAHRRCDASNQALDEPREGCPHSRPMPLRLRVVMPLVALMTLLGVATPPVIEDHLEVGFCSADCPVQHDGHTTALAPPPPASVTRRSAPLSIAAARLADADLGAFHARHAQRA